MRILVVTYEYPPLGGGTAVACEEVVRQLARDPDLAIDVLTSGPGKRLETLRPAGNVEVFRLPVGKRELHYWRPTELLRWVARAVHLGRRLLREREYDAAHCWAGWPSGILGWLGRERTPYVVSLRGSDVPGYNARLKLVDPIVFRHVVRRVWRGAAAVVAVSDDLRELARRTDDRSPIEVIRNGVDVERFAPGARAPATPFTILFVGRLIPRKGVRHLIDAFAAMSPERSDLRLVLVGDGPEREALKARSMGAGVADRVELRGPVPRAALPAAFRESDVFVLPAFEEAMPNAVLEAMASGLPIVTTPTGARELVDGNGVLVDRGSADSIRAALERYVADPEVRAAHGRRSRELAESMSWAEVARRYRALYERASRTTRGRIGASAAT